MHEADLIGIHEARIAHHVAAVRQIDGEDGTAPVLNGAGAVVVERFVVVRADVTPRKHILEMLRKSGIDGHQVFELAVLGTFLDHQDLAVALDDLGLDFADRFVQQDLVVDLTGDDLVADFRDALGAKGICFTRPAQWRFGFLIALEERFVRPLGSERGVLRDLIHPIENFPGDIGAGCHYFFEILNWFVHAQ